MVDITEMIGVDEHYVITSSLAPSDPANDQLKGFAMGQVVRGGGIGPVRKETPIIKTVFKPKVFLVERYLRSTKPTFKTQIITETKMPAQDQLISELKNNLDKKELRPDASRPYHVDFPKQLPMTSFSAADISNPQKYIADDMPKRKRTYNPGGGLEYALKKTQQENKKYQKMIAGNSLQIKALQTETIRLRQTVSMLEKQISDVASNDSRGAVKEQDLRKRKPAMAAKLESVGFKSLPTFVGLNTKAGRIAAMQALAGPPIEATKKSLFSSMSTKGRR